MTCQEFAEKLLDAGNGPEMESHAAGCPSCRTLQRQYAGLRTGLARLASEIHTHHPSDAVESTLLTAFRDHQRRVVEIPKRTSRRPLIVAMSAAAVLAAAFVLPNLLLRNVPPPPAPVPPVLAGKLQIDTTDQVTSPPRKAAPPRPKLARRMPVRPPAKAPESAAVEEPDFLPLPFVTPVAAAETLDVVRVRMPRSAMVRYGLSASTERAWEPVSADIVFGQDGVARAIRFVK